MPTPAPVTEIGYTQAPNYNWWLYDNETTPELIWPQSVYIYDQMRRQDAQVGSVLRAVTETLLRTPWRIDPAGAKSRVTKFVADNLGLPIVGKPAAPPPRMKDRFSWPTHLREALLMLPMGHAYFEQVYRISDDGRFANLRKLAYRPAKTIERIDVASDGGLVAIKQYWTATVREPQPIPVERLVAYIHAKEGGNWLGTSILRNCYKNWLLKDRLLRVQAQTIERNGMGIPLYTAAETEETLTAGLGMATSWRAGEAAGSAVPFGASLRLVGVEGTLPDAMPAVEYHDSQIARAVLAHFLNLGQSTGSWALGTTFADFFTMSLQTLAEQIRDTATQHIVEDLVDLNFGEDEPAPRLVFDEIGSKQAATAAALKTLVDAGILHPDQVLEESSRQQYGLPPADPATATVPPGQQGVTPPEPTQMGDTSPSVAASAAPKEPTAEVAELYDDEADDWEDAIDALILALDELTRVEAAFDPGKHARNPKGSAGGGRFRSMVDRLKDAVTDHADGGKQGHPFDEFDREQLRRVAKARGIELKRGESRDDIAKKLLDHLGGPAAPDKQATPKPEKKTAPKVAKPKVAAPKAVEPPANARASGRDISSSVDYKGLPATYNPKTSENDALKGIIGQQGFDGHPQVVPASEFDAALQRGDVRETWRGLSQPVGSTRATDMAEQYRTGDFHIGLGINGDGTYVAMNKADGQYYGSTLLRIGLHKDAKVISADDLDAEMDAWFASKAGRKSAQLRALDEKLLKDLAKAKTSRSRANIRRKYRNDVDGLDPDRSIALQRDPGIFAALRGYDAIEIPQERSPDKHHEMIILNRTATIVQEG